MNQDSGSTEKKQATGQDGRYKVAPISEGIQRANLEAMDPQMVKLLMETKEMPIPVEDDVKIQGLKNPLCTVVLGFSTDEVLKQLFELKNKQVRYVIVIEPNVGVFYQTIRRKYVAHYLKDTRIDFIVGMNLAETKSELYKCMSRFEESTGPRAALCQHPEVVPDPFCFAETGYGDQKLMDDLTQTVVQAAQQVFISMGCASDSWSRWSQSSKNFKNMQDKYNMRNLVGKWGDYPAVVVGGGPSMEEFIEHAKKYDLQNKSLIIACDASLRRLLKEGIRPHIVTRCERKYTEIFDGVSKEDTKDIFFAAYPWVDYRFFDLFQESFMLFRANGLCTWTGYDHISVNGGVSSANAALELAYKLGFKNVYVTGIDLCFIDNKSHVAGTKVEFDIYKSKKAGLWTDVETNDGKTSTTIPVWQRCHAEYVNSIMKYNTEAAKQKQTPIKVYNTSQKGAKIHGTHLVKWKDLGTHFKHGFNPVERIRANILKMGKKEAKAFDETKKKGIEVLGQMDKELKALFHTLDDHFENNMREESKILAQLQAIYEPTEFFKTFEQYKNALKSIYSAPCTPIDEFKSKWYLNPDFSNLILDTVQLDTFKAENKANSLKNLVSVDFERLKMYAIIHHGLFKVIHYYVKEMIHLINGEETFYGFPEAEVIIAEEV